MHRPLGPSEGPILVSAPSGPMPEDGRVQIELTTTGAQSGRQRTATLYAWEDGDDLVIVGSRGGAARNPAWVHNLRANPRASLRAGKRSWDVEAREVRDGAERDRL